MQVSSIFSSRSRFALLLLCVSAFFAAVSGCHRSPSSDVVATVNGKDILRADLDRNYQISLGDNPQKPSPQEADIQRLRVLHQMIQDEILQQRAAKLNLTASDEDVNARLAELKAPYTPDQFLNLLKQRNMSLDDLKRDIRRQFTETKLLNNEIESKINVTDAQIADFYAQHQAEFDVIEPEYHIAQIVVTNMPAQSGNMQNKASGDPDPKKRIEALYNRLESGQDFASVAAQFSEDPNTASMGGDMGFARESQLKSDPAVYEAISKLKPDQFTGVLPINDPGPGHKIVGYAIYKFLGREPAGQRLLTDPNVRQTIHQTLHDSQKQLLQNAYLETLQDEARVRNYLAEQILKQGAQ